MQIRAAQIELGNRVAAVLRAARRLDGQELPDLDEALIAALRAGGVLGIALGRHPEIAGGVPGVRDALWEQTLGAAIQAHTLARVTTRLQRDGIDPILLKGLATARFYSAPAARPAGDIDLLVSEPDLPAAAESLRALGYDVSVPQVTYGAGPIATAYPRGELEGFHADAGIDLQTHLWPLGKREVQDALRSQNRMSVEGVEARVLPPAIEIRFLAAHAAKHAFLRPLWSCDLTAAIEHFDGLDWETVLSGSPRLRTWVGVSLGIAARLLEGDVPTPVARPTADAADWLIPSVLAHWGGMRQVDRREDVRRALLVHRDPPEVARIVRELWPDALEAMAALGWPFLRPLAGPSRAALALYRAVHFFSPAPVTQE